MPVSSGGIDLRSQSLDVRCLRFLLVVGGTFTVMGVCFVVIASNGGPMKIMAIVTLIVGLFLFIPGIYLAYNMKKRAAEAVRQQQNEGPAVTGYNPPHNSQPTQPEYPPQQYPLVYSPRYPHHYPPQNSQTYPQTPLASAPDDPPPSYSTIMGQQ